MTVSGFQMKFEELVSRYRGRDGHPMPQEVEHLYTEGCAELLRLEAELLRTKRRARAAQADSADDPRAAREADELQRRFDEVTGEVAAMRKLVQVLRTGVDWAQAQAEAEAQAKAI